MIAISLQNVMFFTSVNHNQFGHFWAKISNFDVLLLIDAAHIFSYIDTDFLKRE